MRVSIRLMSEIWQMTMPPAEKLVFLALADAANDEGLCWPSIATVARKSGLSERSVQRAIRDFQSRKWLRREEVIGKGCKYYLTPRHSVTPDTVSPVTNETPTPDTVSPKPSRTIIPSEAKASSGECAPAKRGTRLPSDFVFPDEWKEYARTKRRWSDDDISGEFEDFRDYWIAKPGKDGTKLDWPATWRKWVRNSRRASGSAQPGQSSGKQWTAEERAAYAAKIANLSDPDPPPRAKRPQGIGAITSGIVGQFQ
jgi:hypothetical protein